MKAKENPFNEDHQKIQDSQQLLRLKKLFFAFCNVFFSIKKCFYTKILKYFKRELKVN